MSSTKTTKTVTIEKRGTFNDDSFFKDSWNEFDKAMGDVVHKWDSPVTSTTTRSITAPETTRETKSVYRQIRSSNLTSDDSQAVSCTEEDGKYKIVIDVKDFSPEDINVKVVDETIVVEGKIEKKEGNAISTQKFVRRFMLPSGINMGAITSALSRDGVLTVNAPKLAISNSSANNRSIPVAGSTATYHGNPNRRIEYDFAAGRPTNRDNEPFNPTGAKDSYCTKPTQDGSGRRVIETLTVSVPDRRGSGQKDEGWSTFNDMVEKSQKEMDDMMRKHTINPSILGKDSANNKVVATTFHGEPSNAVTKRDVIKDGNTVTERQEKSWKDNPAPGVNRSNKAVQESSEIKDSAGKVIGHRDKRQQESKAEGSREEILPDGTKRQVFTKSYETRNTYSANSNLAKAL